MRSPKQSGSSESRVLRNLSRCGIFFFFFFSYVTTSHEVGEELICGERRNFEEVEWKFEVGEKTKFESFRTCSVFFVF